MYETELMREILKSPEAQKMIQQISPRYGSAYVFLWLMQVTGAEWDQMMKWVEEFQLQVVPQTATWSLEYWEKEYNIISNPSWSYERRRQNILNKIHSKGPMNPKKLESIASVASGFPARIEENTDKNRFTIYLSAAEFSVDEEAVRKAIDAAKPARLIYDIRYEVYIQSTQYMAGLVQRTQTEVNLRQIN